MTEYISSEIYFFSRGILISLYEIKILSRGFKNKKVKRIGEPVGRILFWISLTNIGIENLLEQRKIMF